MEINNTDYYTAKHANSLSMESIKRLYSKEIRKVLSDIMDEATLCKTSLIYDHGLADAPVIKYLEHLGYEIVKFNNHLRSGVSITGIVIKW